MAEVWEVHPVTGKPLGNADRRQIWGVLLRRDAARFARRVATSGRTPCPPHAARQGSKGHARRAKILRDRPMIEARHPTEKG